MTVINLSTAGASLLQHVGDPLGPRELCRAWAAGELTVADLRELLPLFWTRIDQPTRDVGAALWVPMFRYAGYLAVPSNTRPLLYPLVVYRGAPAERRIGMSWSVDRSVAEHHRARCAAQEESARLYRAAVTEDAVLAFFDSRNEREIVADPSALGDITQVT